jgi:hypothetical protein
MIVDVDVLKAIAIFRTPVNGARSVADLLDIENDDVLAAQLRRLVQEELLDRYQMAVSAGFFYKLTTKGRDYLTENGVDLAKLPPPKKKFKADAASTRTEAASTKADNPGASPGVRASRTEAPAGNRVKSSAAAGTSVIAATAPPTRLGGEEGSNSTRRIHRVEVVADNEDEPTTPAPPQQPRESSMATEKVTDRSRLVELIAKKPGIFPADAASQLSVGVNSVYQHLTVLRKRGTIVPADGGGWRVATAGAAAAPTPSPRKAAAKKKARAKTKKHVVVKVRKPYTRRAAAVVTTRAAAKSGNKDRIIAAEAGKVMTLASFTKRGEIVVTHDGAAKHLNVDESREVVELVRAFDKAGLLPKAA